MSQSIVRWKIAPDIWKFTDEITEDPYVPPEKVQTTKAYSIAKWNDKPDTWGQVFGPVSTVTIQNVNISKTNLWNGGDDLINLTCLVDDINKSSIYYNILVNSEIVLLSDPQPTPTELNIQIPTTTFKLGKNELKLAVFDESDVDTNFKYIITKEDRDTFTFERIFDFKEDYINDNNIKAIYKEGLALKSIGDGTFELDIPTEGKSKIKNISISGSGNQNGKSIIPMLTSNNQDGYEASASSIYSSSYDAWKAFNKVTSIDADSWVSANVSFVPQWLQIKLPIPQIVTYYELTGPYNSAQALKSWRFEGSNDETNWAVLDIRTELKVPAQGEKLIYEVENIGNYEFYRLYITEKFGTTNYVRVGELQLYITDLDTIEDLVIDNKMTYTKDLGAGKVYESRLLTEYSDITKIDII